jgi:hypothetical protein
MRSMPELGPPRISLRKLLDIRRAVNQMFYIARRNNEQPFPILKGEFINRPRPLRWTAVIFSPVGSAVTAMH